MEHVMPRYQKANNQFSHYEPLSEWGSFTRYIEIGQDHFALRHVDHFANGFAFRYDRNQWQDGAGMLADAKFPLTDTSVTNERFGLIESIDQQQFESAWTSAQSAPNQPQNYQCEQRWPVYNRPDFEAS